MSDISSSLMPSSPEQPLLETRDSRTDSWAQFFIDQYHRLARRELDSVAVTFLFGIAVVFGIGLKLLFGSFVTIGYEDYRLAENVPNTNLNALQKRLLEQGGSFAYAPTETAGPACKDQER